MRLRTLLAEYPHTAALRRGEVTSDHIAFEFADVTPIWAGFKSMVRQKAFDVSEMAIVTYLIAKSFGKPMVLLPAVMTARVQHAFAIYNGERGTLTPPQLAGKRVGIRSFTTTTGAWLRGMFANDYGLDLAKRELGDVRGSPCRRIRRHHRARAARQDDHPDAARRRARRRARRPLRRSPRQVAVRRSRRRREGLGGQAQDRARSTISWW